MPDGQKATKNFSYTTATTYCSPIPTDAKHPSTSPKGLGARPKRAFDIVRLDPEERARDPKADLLLSGFNLKTKATGYYRDRIESTDKPAELIARDKRFSNLQKAKDADVLLFRQSSFEEYPDLWTSDLDFQNTRKISDVNPQQKDYLWGTAELVEWVSLDGKPLQGILYKPENFDPAQKYPMLVYFYEKMSNQLHAHRSPRASGGSINFSFYVSRGYLIFIPDIPYKVGFPGESAVNAVVSGVTHLINRGFVNPDRIGVQGHSWGGYQIAYMITRTNIFRAAEAGAPVSNMISAYGGIRWSSGLSRMMQYEKSQSRIGGLALGSPHAVYRKLPHLLGRQNSNAIAHLAQRQRRRSTLVSGHRTLCRPAPPGQTRMADQLQRRGTQRSQTPQPQRLEHPPATIL